MFWPAGSGRFCRVPEGSIGFHIFTDKAYMYNLGPPTTVLTRVTPGISSSLGYFTFSHYCYVLMPDTRLPNGFSVCSFEVELHEVFKFSNYSNILRFIDRLLLLELFVGFDVFTLLGCGLKYV
jgi:hypothetical protein